MTEDAFTLAPLGDPATLRTLRYFEDEYEAARWAYLQAPWYMAAEAWERFNFWVQVVRGYCRAHHLTPSVAVGRIE